jgi:hypothetical protein
MPNRASASRRAFAPRCPAVAGSSISTFIAATRCPKRVSTKPFSPLRIIAASSVVARPTRSHLLAW